MNYECFDMKSLVMVWGCRMSRATLTRLRHSSMAVASDPTMANSTVNLVGIVSLVMA